MLTLELLHTTTAVDRCRFPVTKNRRHRTSYWLWVTSLVCASGLLKQYDWRYTASCYQTYGWKQVLKFWSIIAGLMPFSSRARRIYLDLLFLFKNVSTVIMTLMCLVILQFHKFEHEPYNLRNTELMFKTVFMLEVTHSSILFFLE